MIVRYDSDADATTVDLVAGPVARTVEVLDDYVLVDVDASGQPVSIEILSSPAAVDETVYMALADKFPDLDLAGLRAVLAGRSPATA